MCSLNIWGIYYYLTISILSSFQFPVFFSQLVLKVMKLLCELIPYHFDYKFLLGETGSQVSYSSSSTTQKSRANSALSSMWTWADRVLTTLNTTGEPRLPQRMQLDISFWLNQWKIVLKVKIMLHSSCKVKIKLECAENYFLLIYHSLWLFTYVWPVACVKFKKITW